MKKTTFTENLENNQIIAHRTFNAPLQRVWEAWGNPEILCQWWAPQPYLCEIKELNFEPGGRLIYCMKGPEGDVHWGRMDYLQIKEHEMLEAEDYFCDESGKKNEQFDPMHLKVVFEEVDGTTKIVSTTTFASPDALKQMAEMGATEGLGIAFDQLSELLA